MADASATYELELEKAVAAETPNDSVSNGMFLAVILVYVAFLVFGATMFMFVQYDFNNVHTYHDEPCWAKLKSNITEARSSLSLLGRQQQQQQQHHQEHRSCVVGLCPHLNHSRNLDHLLNKDAVLSDGLEYLIDEIQFDCPELQTMEVTVEKYYELTFMDALYFSMTIITTIGYGHIIANSSLCKVLCMFYAMVGIPLTGILLAKTSSVFGEKVFHFYQSKISGDKQRSQWFIVSATMIYIFLGCVVFLFLPAVIFVYVEHWTYLESVYFAFITLTTIGFGDLVTGNGMDQNWKHAVYQVFVIFWILISLGYWVMVANFITRALRSKKLHASLVERAKVLKAMMASQGNQNPVFLPQRGKTTMNFMLQLSSMLPEGNMSSADNLKLQGAINEGRYEEGGAGAAQPNSPLIMPGIASLFNLPNKQLHDSLVIKGSENSFPPTATNCSSPTSMDATDTTVSLLSDDGGLDPSTRETSPDTVTD